MALLAARDASAHLFGGNLELANMSSLYVRLRARARRFFDGEPVRNDPNSAVVMTGTRRHPVAQGLLDFRDFYVRHWKWLLGAAGGLVAWIAR
jgi:hypothetical protein